MGFPAKDFDDALFRPLFGYAFGKKQTMGFSLPGKISLSNFI